MTLLVFAFNDQQDPSINLLAILVGTGMVIVWAWVSHGIYKTWCLDALEGSKPDHPSWCHLLYFNQSRGSQLAIGYTSVSIALATFIGIIAYHIFQQLRHTNYKLLKNVPKLNLKFKKTEHQAKGG